MLRPLPAAAVLALCLTTMPAAAQSGGGRLRVSANPSALIAADIAMAQAIPAKGSNAALAATMAEGAEIVLPPRLSADAVLRRKMALPARPHRPDAAWIACDGTTGLTRGAWQGADGSAGWYATVWQRHPKKGTYQWRLMVEAVQSPAPAAPEFLLGLVADCPARPARPEAVAPEGRAVRGKPGKAPPPQPRPLAGSLPRDDAPAGSDMRDGQSFDGSLAWRVGVWPDGSRHMRGYIWKDGSMTEILYLDAAPLAGAQG
jgi:hypothetical protein